MAGPWEAFAPAAPTGPWSVFVNQQPNEGPQPYRAPDPVDAAKGLGIGLANAGVGVAGLPGDAFNLGAAALDAATAYLRGKPGGDAIPGLVENPTRLPGAQDIQAGIEKFTGPFYQPKTPEGRFSKTFGEFAPMMAAGSGGPFRRLLQTAIPAASSELAGQVYKGQPEEPYARAAGAFAGPAAAAGVRRSVTPFPTSPERQRLVQTLEREGVTDLTAGQKTGSRPLQWSEQSLSDVPFAGNMADVMRQSQQEQFTSAVLRRVGETAERATPDVLNRAFDRIGRQFDDLAVRNTMIADGALVAQVRAGLDEYKMLTPPALLAPGVQQLADNVQSLAARAGGQVSGEQYKHWRTQIDKLARGESRAGNTERAGALYDIRNALDDAMERSVSAQDMAAWREARNQYRNMLVVERAATGAGAEAREGLISPMQLRSAVVQQNRRAFARGRGDFAELARAGEAIMKPLPQSGSAPRAFAMGLPMVLGGGLGTALGGGPMSSMLGSIAGFAGPPIAGNILMSRPIQSWLSNQALSAPPQQMTPALARMLLLGSSAVPAELR